MKFNCAIFSAIDMGDAAATFLGAVGWHGGGRAASRLLQTPRPVQVITVHLNLYLDAILSALRTTHMQRNHELLSTVVKLSILVECGLTQSCILLHQESGLVGSD